MRKGVEMKSHLLVIAVFVSVLAARAHAQSARKDALPAGALVRILKQSPPRTNPLNALLAWPEPPPARYATRLLVFSPDGKHLAIANNDLPIRLVDASSGKEIAQYPAKGHHIHALRFSNSGTLLVVSSSWQDATQTISLWDVATGKTMRRYLGTQPAQISIATKKPPVTTPINVGTISVSSDGKFLIGERHDGIVCIWDLTAKTVQPLITARHVHAPFTFSTDGKCFISGANSNDAIQIWDSASGREVRRLDGRQYRFPYFAFSPDSRFVASGLADPAIHWWDVETGKKIRALRGHEEQTSYLAISPDARLLASGSEDATCAKSWPGNRSPWKSAGASSRSLLISMNRHRNNCAAFEQLP